MSWQSNLSFDIRYYYWMEFKLLNNMAVYLEQNWQQILCCKKVNYHICVIEAQQFTAIDL